MTAPDLKVEFGFGYTWKSDPAAVVWVDETSRVLQPERVAVGRGASSARGDVDVGDLRLVLKNDDRRFDPTYTSGPYYGDLVPGVPVRVSAVSATLDLPGGTGDYASSPDKAAFDITGDLDIRVKVTPDDWTPALQTVLVSNRASGFAVTGYEFSLNTTTGYLVLQWGNGATAPLAVSTTGPSTTVPWLRATLDVDNGAAGNDVAFYESEDGVNWTAVGSTVTTAGTTSISASSTDLNVGRRPNASLPFAGTVERVQVRNGIGGTLVVDCDFEVQTVGVSSFTDDTGNVWTLGGSASLAAGAGFPVWAGNVAKWPQRYEPGGFSWVPVEGFDGFDKFSRAKIPRSVLESEILADNPVGYWKLDETSGTQMFDSSGNGRHGVYTPGSTGLSKSVESADGGTISGLQWDGGHAGFAGYGAVKLSRGQTLSVVAWPDAVAGTTMSLIETGTGNPNEGSLIEQSVSAAGSSTITAGAVGPTITGNAVCEASTDTRLHHIAFRLPTSGDARIYLDGVATGTTGPGGTAFATPPGYCVGALKEPPEGEGFAGGTWNYLGFEASVAIFDSDIGATRIAAHSSAALAPLDGQTTDERLGWILDEIGWDLGPRDFETGAATLGPATFKPGDNALDYLRLVTRTEDGLLFFQPDGTLRFHHRYWRYLDALATTVQFTFTDADADQSYAEFDLDLDDELLVNVARFTRRGGTEQVTSNSTSVDTYGEAELSQGDLLLETDAEVLSLAEWTVATRSTPLPRVPKIRVPLHRYSAHDQAAVLRLDLGHRVRCVRTPDVGSAITLDFLVAGVRHDIGGGEWWWEAFVTPVPEDTVSLFLWDSSLLDGTDVLAP